jgi:ribonuclease HI
MAGLFRAAFDGGSRGNPGTAAWGVAVLDDAGACIEEHAGLLGHTTNNVAEYHGLLEALKLARAAAARRVEIISDSELVVRQIQGRYKVKNPGLKPLFAEAMGYITGFESFEITHVRRENNREADRLVNEALDRALSD